ncbi:MAG: dTDP-4-dehydrorhamnose reductase [Devosia sp. 67-54]|uniref:dTDP-4-dehydrorhamnose reductase n=1 Tax=unclassified Devosia TaxID=196773 RepID=UPI00095DF20E|nr:MULTISPECIES: dTDP-4-dehydrorhamnose reductase [unclassified Devosia]MBN9307625.1 dTDP-4-dehydrorhamnose reductase [Devosia sp.]OJX19955.1 MAG: dTDP-4-dehydrorhamnose reductase [Devosia sp. 67-54]
MRLLVLGKSGQVGWELQRALLPLGDVVALGHTEADFEDAAQLRRAVQDAAPDIIVNASAYTAVDKAESEPDRADRINHRAVGELAELAAARDAWLIHYSTDYVFDGRKPLPYVETDAVGPAGVYGRSKLDGERAVAASGARALVLRTSWVHAGRGHNFIRTMLRLARERDSLRVVDDQIGAPTSAALIADVTAHAIAAVARGEPPAPGLYHLAAAGETSWHGLACFVVDEALRRGATLTTAPERIVAIPTSQYPTPARRPANSRLDTSKLRTALGISLPDWRVPAARSVQELLADRL